MPTARSRPRAPAGASCTARRDGRAEVAFVRIASTRTDCRWTSWCRSHTTEWAARSSTASLRAKLGYGVEFDEQGRAGANGIDFEAVAQLMSSLKSSARRQGVRIAKVIFAP